MNYFNPPNTGVQPLPTRRKLRPIPAQDDLFSIQNNFIKALQDLDELESQIKDLNDADRNKLDIHGLRTSISNGYKKLNRYLKEHSTS
jgi:hypothetical protein